jgi:hypothetical protein
LNQVSLYLKVWVILFDKSYIINKERKHCFHSSIWTITIGTTTICISKEKVYLEGSPTTNVFQDLQEDLDELLIPNQRTLLNQ